jgi:YHS domain-containing protein
MDNTAKQSAKCPVCNMLVETGCCRGLTARRHGAEYHFCSKACLNEFKRKASGRRKGWFSRWLERMDKANRESFGGSGPKCH